MAATSVDFATPVQKGDRISVYPVFEAFDIADVTRARQYVLRDSASVIDPTTVRFLYLTLAGRLHQITVLLPTRARERYGCVISSGLIHCANCFAVTRPSASPASSSVVPS